MSSFLYYYPKAMSKYCNLTDPDLLSKNKRILSAMNGDYSFILKEIIFHLQCSKKLFPTDLSSLSKLRRCIVLFEG